MSSSYKTPDVYVKEISVFPPSVAEVGSAIPAFIGHTEKAARGVRGLTLTPTRIGSIKEYEELFGGPHDPTVKIKLIGVKPNYAIAGVALDGASEKTPPKYFLYWALRLFFDNGGSQCYVVSVGDYKTDPVATEFKKGLDAIATEDEPTLLVAPEAASFGVTDYSNHVQATLKQCEELKDRFAIFDLFPKDEIPPATVTVPPTLPTLVSRLDKRGYFGTSSLKYAAAYHPLLRTTFNPFVNDGETNVSVDLPPEPAAVPPVLPPAVPPPPPTLGSLRTSDSAAYNIAKAAVRSVFLVVPPSAAVAGAYAAVDAARGVWKAPANVSLASVIEPVEKFDSVKQADFNVDSESGAGKSINVIRAFAGRGTLIWGARTLAGNDNEWRYVNVRRFFNMVEESIKKSTYWAVFEPNDANTWVKVRGMIESYLTDKWRDGALAGATPKDAFFVRCGLGTTMSPQDILEGRLNVEIGLAVVRPAEFIVLKFSHKLQVS